MWTLLLITLIVLEEFFRGLGIDPGEKKRK